MSVSARAARVNRYFTPRLARLRRFLRASVREPRSPRGRTRGLGCLLDALLIGLMACDRALRDVEDRTERLNLLNDKDGRSAGRIPDTTMGDLLAVLNPDDLMPVLVRQVRDMVRRNELAPVGLPIGVVVVDGKSLGKLTHDANGHGLLQHEASSGLPFWLVRVLRAVLSSAAGKPALGQLTIPGREGETTHFIPFANWLYETYGRFGMFEVLDVDAGLLSRANFEHVDQLLQCGIIAGLKGNQPDLHDEAVRVLEPLIENARPKAETDWEPCKGKLIRRSLYRTADLDGYLGWNHLRQVWLVVQETAEPEQGEPRRPRGHHQPLADWKISRELRYFVTNLPWNRLTPSQILLVVRNHWVVENDCFHALDVRWGEDRPAWCTRGNAVLVLGLLRLLAYNLVQHLRKRHLRRILVRTGASNPWEWRDIFRLIDEVLGLLGAELLVEACGCRAEPGT